MSIQRYKEKEPIQMRSIALQIPSGISVTLVGQDPVLVLDLNLSDDAGKDDLDQYMATIGWEFVETSPTSPRPVLPLVTQSPIISKIATPPGSPTAGDRHIVAVPGTGAWAGHDKEISEWDGSAWQYTVPVNGMAAWDEAEKQTDVYSGDWEPGTPQELAVFNAAAAILTAASSPTQSERNDREMLDFADGVTETAYFTGVVPRSYVVTGPLRVKIFWVAATATTGSARWLAAVERLEGGGPNVDSDNFPANQSDNSPTDGTNGVINSLIIPFTNAEADGIRPGNPFRLRIRRQGGAAGDTLTDIAQIMRVVLVQ